MDGSFKVLKRYIQGLLLFTVFIASSVAALSDKEPSLYSRFGGMTKVIAVSDAFIDQLHQNQVLNASPSFARLKVNLPKSTLKLLFTTMLYQATIKPEEFTVRHMMGPNQYLNVTEKEWQAMLQDFKFSLNKYGVADKEQQELFKIIARQKQEISLL